MELRVLCRSTFLDSFVMSKFGLGLDNMLRSYLIDEVSNLAIEDAFVQHTNWDIRKGKPYVIACSEKLEKVIESDKIRNHSYSWRFYGPRSSFALNIQDEN
jgi:uridine phosphorylase